MSSRRRILAVSLAALVLLGGGIAAWLFSPPHSAPRQKIRLAMPEVLPETDWPQWRGARRDGVSLDKGLLAAWPEGGPRLLWAVDTLGAGYSAPAAAGGMLFVPGTREDLEVVHVLDGRDGRPLGEAVLGRRYRNDWGDGPRGTPVVDGGFLYALSGAGDLIRLDLASGEVDWRLNIYGELGGQLPGWGCGESPLVDGDRVIVTPGGAAGTLAALDKRRGKLLWRSKELQDPAGYSSCVPAEIGGVRQYVQMTFKHVFGTSVDGKLLWRHPRRGPNAPVPTPIVRGDLVYATSGYGAGCHLLRIQKAGEAFVAEELYASKAVSNHHGGVILAEGRIYGYAEGKGWICQDFQTGELLWREKDKLEKGSVTAADGKLFCYGEKDGTLAVLEISAEGWKERGRFKIPRASATPRKNGGIWTHPVIADGRLYLRDQERLYCYALR